MNSREQLKAKIQEAVEECGGLTTARREGEKHTSRLFLVLIDHFAEQVSDVDEAKVRSLASNVSWILREMKLPPPIEADVQAASGEAAQRFLDYVGGQMLRFDFRFRALKGFTTSALSRHRGDALIIALHGLALAGHQKPEARPVLAASVTSSNADARSRHCCLHAYWLANHFPDQSELLISLANTMLLLDGPNSNTFFRRAFAYRRRGLATRSAEDLQLALADITEAFELAGRDPEVNQDFVRERELIALSMMILESRTI